MNTHHPWTISKAATVRPTGEHCQMGPLGLRWVVAPVGDVIMVRSHDSRGLHGKLYSKAYPHGLECFLPTSAIDCVREDAPFFEL